MAIGTNIFFGLKLNKNKNLDEHYYGTASNLCRGVLDTTLCDKVCQ
jgi:hypothetical protein